MGVFFTALARKIFTLRKTQGYSQRELARLCNISCSYLSKLESGKRIQGCTLDVFFVLAESLNISPSSLLTLTAEDIEKGFLYDLYHAEKKPISVAEAESIYNSYIE